MRYLRRQNPWLLSFVMAVLLVGIYQFTFAAPSAFVPGTIVRIEYGSTTSEIAKQLSTVHIISHPELFSAALRLSGQSNTIQAGIYTFASAANVFSVTHQLVTGSGMTAPVHLTFVEGTTLSEASVVVQDAFPIISTTEFLAAAEGEEGYLFPDTYFFAPVTSAAAIVAQMHDNFITKVNPYMPEVLASGHSLAEIVTMASLLEKEARTDTDRQMISGILWNRIRLHMPLQVDAVFGYIYDRPTYSPSYNDLKIDSHYNTYRHVGLPPGPIDSPGIDSIIDALNPTKTDYLYYLTDKEGVMHYATTYAEHEANLRKYLK